MAVLNRKLLRDLWRARAQALAVALVIAGGVATVVMSLGALYSLRETRDAYYERNRFADVFARLERAPEHLIARIAAIPGVARAESRIVHQVLLDMPGVAEPVRAAVISLPESGQQHLNVIVLRAGRGLRPHHADDVVVNEAFAEAHRLRPGDRIAATINGKQRRLLVAGIALSPEFVYALAPGELVPDNRRFGVLWMGREALEAAYDLTGAFNDVVLALDRSVPEPEVIARLDALLDRYGGTGAYGREHQVSDAYLESEMDQLTTVIRIVPPIFLAVAAFLLNTVIGRMIQIEREQIGLLKASGYSDLAVGWHYLKFGLAVAALGIAIGAAAGAWFARDLTQIYAEFFRFPFLFYRPAPLLFALTAGVALLAAAAGAALAVRRAVALAPAVAMTPPAPTLYRAGLSDRTGLARWMTASTRMIVRHVGRWPLRSSLTTLGIASAIGLLVVSLYFVDAVDAMLESFFSRSHREDLTVRFVDPRGDEVRHALAGLPAVLRAELTRTVPVRLRSGQRSRRVEIVGLDPDAELYRQVSAQGRTVRLPPQGLILTDRLAELLGATAGDTVTVEVLEGRRAIRQVAVSRVVTEFVGTAAYMDRAALNRLLLEGAVADGAHLKIDGAGQDRLFQALKQMPVVLGVAVKAAAVRAFREMIEQHLLTIIGFYIVFASAIAVGVVYNSARISLSERSRELASLMVLGYHRSEVAMILVGELALLTLLALPLGCLFGYGLVRLMVALFATDLYRLPFVIEPSTYGYAVAIVLAAAGAAALAAARRVAGLDLVAVLKTRD